MKENKTRYRPGSGETICPLSMQLDGGKNRGGSTSVVQTRLCWPAVAKLHAASVPIAYAAAPWDRQTDGSLYSKMPPYGGGIINAKRSSYFACGAGLRSVLLMLQH